MAPPCPRGLRHGLGGPAGVAEPPGRGQGRRADPGHPGGADAASCARPERPAGCPATPGIVTVHDAGILADGRPYLVMELCPGGSLNALAQGAGAADRRSAYARSGVRIADALAAAHARGVLHRDVKPPNILIDAYDHVGSGRLRPGRRCPIPAWSCRRRWRRSPRRTRRRRPSASSRRPQFGDVYSLAATLYALLKGTAAARAGRRDTQHRHGPGAARRADRADPGGGSGR